MNPIKPEHSPINLLGKMLYRGQPLWEQRRKTIILLWSIVIGLFFGGLCVVFFLLENWRH